MGEEPDFEGLAEGLEGEPREARLRLLRELHDDGVSVEDLRRAVEEQRLALLPVERVLQGEGRYSEAELAERGGLDLDVVRKGRAAFGLAVAADDDEPRYDDRDVEVVKGFKAVLDSGMTLDDVLGLNRVVGRAMLQVAAAARGKFAEAALRAGATEHDLAVAAARAAEELVPQMEPTLAYAFEAHLRQLLRSDVIDASDIAAGRTAGAREVSVAFADLVGFTRLGEDIPAEELGGVVERLEELASERVEHPVTFVKTIGDAVMLVAPTPDPLIATALELSDTVRALGDEFPQLRIGISCGPALERAGDWFGSPVNTASRITGVARPGSVVVSESVTETAEQEWRWSRVPQRKKLKGLGSVKLFRVRRPGDADDDGS